MKRILKVIGFVAIFLILVTAMFACSKQGEASPEEVQGGSVSGETPKQTMEKKDMLDLVFDATNEAAALNGENLEKHVSTVYTLIVGEINYTVTFKANYAERKQDSELYLRIFDNQYHMNRIFVYYKDGDAYVQSQQKSKSLIDIGITSSFDLLYKLVTMFDTSETFISESIAELFNTDNSVNIGALINQNSISHITVDETRESIEIVNTNLDTQKGMINGAIKDLFSPFGKKLDLVSIALLNLRVSDLAQIELSTADAKLMNFQINDGATERVKLKAAGDLTDTVRTFDLDMDILVTEEHQTITLDDSDNPYLHPDDYPEMDMGALDYKGTLFIPFFDTTYDAEFRARLSSLDNTQNQVMFNLTLVEDQMGGAFYKDELFYVDINGLQTQLQGAIDLEALNLPRVMFTTLNLAQELTLLTNKILKILNNEQLTDEDGSVRDIFLEKLESDEPNNTIYLTVDMELIRALNGGDVNVVETFAKKLNISPDELAQILGDDTFDNAKLVISYNIGNGDIGLDLYSGDSLIFRLRLSKVESIGKNLVYPDYFDPAQYKELFIPSTTAFNVYAHITMSDKNSVSLSTFLGALIGDISGTNTPVDFMLGDELDVGVSMSNTYSYTDFPDGTRERHIDQKMKTTIYLNNAYFLGIFSCSDPTYLLLDFNFPVGPKGRDRDGEAYNQGAIRIKMSREKLKEAFTELLGEDNIFVEDNLINIAKILMDAIPPNMFIRFTGASLAFDLMPYTDPDTLVHYDAIYDFINVENLSAAMKIQIRFDPVDITSMEGEYYIPVKKTMIKTDAGANETVVKIEDLAGDLDIDNVVLRESSFVVPRITPLDNIEEETIYDVKWHENVLVTFFGNATPSIRFVLTYIPSTVLVTSNKDYYRPTAKLFGEEPSYYVNILDKINGVKVVIAPYSPLFEIDPSLVDTENGLVLPETMRVYFDDGTNGFRPYEIVGFDITNVTSAGMPAEQFTVIIGKGSVAEISFSIEVSVKNREVVSIKKYDATFENEDGTLGAEVEIVSPKGAPVIDSVVIDPYEYALRKSDDNAYTPLPNSVLITFKGIYEETEEWAYNLGWDFDFSKITYNGLVTYSYAYFNNIEVALLVEVQSKIVDYIRFVDVYNKEASADEMKRPLTEQIGQYTVDILETSSLTFPTQSQYANAVHTAANAAGDSMNVLMRELRVYFTDGSYRIIDQKNYSVTDNSYYQKYLPIDLDWSSRTVTNIRQTGTSTPLGSTSVNTAELRFPENIVVNIGIQTISMEVLLPARDETTIGRLDSEEYLIVGYNSFEDGTINYASPEEKYVKCSKAAFSASGYNSDKFFFEFDPYNQKPLPDTVYVVVEQGGNNKLKGYSVEWMPSEIIEEGEDGSFYMTNVSSDERFLMVQGRIGDGDYTVLLTMVVHNMAANYLSIQYYEAKAGGGESAWELNRSSMDIDPYLSYKLPISYDLVLANGSHHPVYDIDWVLVLEKDINGNVLEDWLLSTFSLEERRAYTEKGEIPVDESFVYNYNGGTYTLKSYVAATDTVIAQEVFLTVNVKERLVEGTIVDVLDSRDLEYVDEIYRIDTYENLGVGETETFSVRILNALQSMSGAGRNGVKTAGVFFKGDNDSNKKGYSLPVYWTNIDELISYMRNPLGTSELGADFVLHGYIGYGLENQQELNVSFGIAKKEITEMRFTKVANVANFISVEYDLNPLDTVNKRVTITLEKPMSLTQVDPISGSEVFISPADYLNTILVQANLTFNGIDSRIFDVTKQSIVNGEVVTEKIIKNIEQVNASILGKPVSGTNYTYTKVVVIDRLSNGSCSDPVEIIVRAREVWVSVSNDQLVIEPFDESGLENYNQQTGYRLPTGILVTFADSSSDYTVRFEVDKWELTSNQTTAAQASINTNQAIPYELINVIDRTSEFSFKTTMPCNYGDYNLAVSFPLKDINKTQYNAPANKDNGTLAITDGLISIENIYEVYDDSQAMGFDPAIIPSSIIPDSEKNNEFDDTLNDKFNVFWVWKSGIRISSAGMEKTLLATATIPSYCTRKTNSDGSYTYIKYAQTVELYIYVKPMQDPTVSYEGLIEHSDNNVIVHDPYSEDNDYGGDLPLPIDGLEISFNGGSDSIVLNKDFDVSYILNYQDSGQKAMATAFDLLAKNTSISESINLYKDYVDYLTTNINDLNGLYGGEIYTDLIMEEVWDDIFEDTTNANHSYILSGMMSVAGSLFEYYNIRRDASILSYINSFVDVEDKREILIPFIEYVFSDNERSYKEFIDNSFENADYDFTGILAATYASLGNNLDSVELSALLDYYYEDDTYCLSDSAKISFVESERNKSDYGARLNLYLSGNRTPVEAFKLLYEAADNTNVYKMGILAKAETYEPSNRNMYYPSAANAEKTLFVYKLASKLVAGEKTNLYRYLGEAIVATCNAWTKNVSKTLIWTTYVSAKVASRSISELKALIDVMINSQDEKSETSLKAIALRGILSNDYSSTNTVEMSRINNVKIVVLKAVIAEMENEFESWRIVRHKAHIWNEILDAGSGIPANYITILENVINGELKNEVLLRYKGAALVLFEATEEGGNYSNFIANKRLEYSYIENIVTRNGQIFEDIYKSFGATVQDRKLKARLLEAYIQARYAGETDELGNTLVDQTTEVITSIPYTDRGHAIEAIKTLGIERLKIDLTLPDGQIVYLTVIVLSREIVEVSFPHYEYTTDERTLEVSENIEYASGVYYIDPYDSLSYKLPTEALFRFKSDDASFASETFHIKEWIIPSEYASSFEKTTDIYGNSITYYKGGESAYLGETFTLSSYLSYGRGSGEERQYFYAFVIVLTRKLSATYEEKHHFEDAIGALAMDLPNTLDESMFVNPQLYYNDALIEYYEFLLGEVFSEDIVREYYNGFNVRDNYHTGIRAVKIPEIFWSATAYNEKGIDTTDLTISGGYALDVEGYVEYKNTALSDGWKLMYDLVEKEYETIVKPICWNELFEIKDGKQTVIKNLSTAIAGQITTISTRISNNLYVAAYDDMWANADMNLRNQIRETEVKLVEYDNQVNNDSLDVRKIKLYNFLSTNYTEEELLRDVWVELSAHYSKVYEKDIAKYRSDAWDSLFTLQDNLGDRIASNMDVNLLNGIATRINKSYETVISAATWDRLFYAAKEVDRGYMSQALSVAARRYKLNDFDSATKFYAKTILLNEIISGTYGEKAYIKVTADKWDFDRIVDEIVKDETFIFNVFTQYTAESGYDVEFSVVNSALISLYESLLQGVTEGNLDLYKTLAWDKLEEIIREMLFKELNEISVGLGQSESWKKLWEIWVENNLSFIGDKLEDEDGESFTAVLEDTLYAHVWDKAYDYDDNNGANAFLYSHLNTAFETSLAVNGEFGITEVRAAALNELYEIYLALFGTDNVNGNKILEIKNELTAVLQARAFDEMLAYYTAESNLEAINYMNNILDGNAGMEKDGAFLFIQNNAPSAYVEVSRLFCNDAMINEAVWLALEDKADMYVAYNAVERIMLGRESEYPVHSLERIKREAVREYLSKSAENLAEAEEYYSDLQALLDASDLRLHKEAYEKVFDYYTENPTVVFASNALLLMTDTYNEKVKQEVFKFISERSEYAALAASFSTEISPYAALVEHCSDLIEDYSGASEYLQEQYDLYFSKDEKINVEEIVYILTKESYPTFAIGCDNYGDIVDKAEAENNTTVRTYIETQYSLYLEKSRKENAKWLAHRIVSTSTFYADFAVGLTTYSDLALDLSDKGYFYIKLEGLMENYYESYENELVRKEMMFIEYQEKYSTDVIGCYYTEEEAYDAIYASYVAGQNLVALNYLDSQINKIAKEYVFSSLLTSEEYGDQAWSYYDEVKIFNEYLNQNEYFLSPSTMIEITKQGKISAFNILLTEDRYKDIAETNYNNGEVSKDTAFDLMLAYYDTLGNNDAKNYMKSLLLTETQKASVKLAAFKVLRFGPDDWLMVSAAKDDEDGMDFSVAYDTILSYYTEEGNTQAVDEITALYQTVKTFDVVKAEVFYILEDSATYGEVTKRYATSPYDGYDNLYAYYVANNSTRANELMQRADALKYSPELDAINALIAAASETNRYMDVVEMFYSESVIYASVCDQLLGKADYYVMFEYIKAGKLGDSGEALTETLKEEIITEYKEELELEINTLEPRSDYIDYFLDEVKAYYASDSIDATLSKVARAALAWDELYATWWCTEYFESNISGYNNTQVQIGYDECNPFAIINGYSGAYNNMPASEDVALSQAKIDKYNLLSQRFTAFMENFTIPDDGSEYTPSISVDANSDYNDFYNVAEGFFRDDSLVEFVRNASYNLSGSAIIGLNSPYAMRFGDSLGEQSVNLQQAIAKLFGYNSKNAFVAAAQTLVDIYTAYRGRISENNEEDRALKNGCFYTSNGNFIFPIAVRNNLSANNYAVSTLLAYLIIDTNGFMSIWVSNLKAVLWATNYNSSYYTAAEIRNELYCKNVLFVNGLNSFEVRRDNMKMLLNGLILANTEESLEELKEEALKSYLANNDANGSDAERKAYRKAELVITTDIDRLALAWDNLYESALVMKNNERVDEMKEILPSLSADNSAKAAAFVRYYTLCAERATAELSIIYEKGLTTLRSDKLNSTALSSYSELRDKYSADMFKVFAWNQMYATSAGDKLVMDQAMNFASGTTEYQKKLNAWNTLLTGMQFQESSKRTMRRFYSIMEQQDFSASWDFLLTYYSNVNTAVVEKMNEVYDAVPSLRYSEEERKSLAWIEIYEYYEEQEYSEICNKMENSYCSGESAIYRALEKLIENAEKVGMTKDYLLAALENGNGNTDNEAAFELWENLDLLFTSISGGGAYLNYMDELYSAEIEGMRSISWLIVERKAVLAAINPKLNLLDAYHQVKSDAWTAVYDDHGLGQANRTLMSGIMAQTERDMDDKATSNGLVFDEAWDRYIIYLENSVYQRFDLLLFGSSEEQFSSAYRAYEKSLNEIGVGIKKELDAILTAAAERNVILNKYKAVEASENLGIPTLTAEIDELKAQTKSGNAVYVNTWNEIYNSNFVDYLMLERIKSEVKPEGELNEEEKKAALILYLNRASVLQSIKNEVQEKIEKYTSEIVYDTLIKRYSAIGDEEQYQYLEEKLICDYNVELFGFAVEQYSDEIKDELGKVLSGQNNNIRNAYMYIIGVVDTTASDEFEAIYNEKSTIAGIDAYEATWEEINLNPYRIASYNNNFRNLKSVIQSVINDIEGESFESVIIDISFETDEVRQRKNAIMLAYMNTYGEAYDELSNTNTISEDLSLLIQASEGKDTLSGFVDALGENEALASETISETYDYMIAGWRRIQQNAMLEDYLQNAAGENESAKKVNAFTQMKNYYTQHNPAIANILEDEYDKYYNDTGDPESSSVRTWEYFFNNAELLNFEDYTELNDYYDDLLRVYTILYYGLDPSRITLTKGEYDDIKCEAMLMFAEEKIKESLRNIDYENVLSSEVKNEIRLNNVLEAWNDVTERVPRLAIYLSRALEVAAEEAMSGSGTGVYDFREMAFDALYEYLLNEATDYIDRLRESIYKDLKNSGYYDSFGDAINLVSDETAIKSKVWSMLYNSLYYDTYGTAMDEIRKKVNSEQGVTDEARLEARARIEINAAYFEEWTNTVSDAEKRELEMYCHEERARLYDRIIDENRTNESFRLIESYLFEETERNNQDDWTTHLGDNNEKFNTKCRSLTYLALCELFTLLREGFENADKGLDESQKKSQAFDLIYDLLNEEDGAELSVAVTAKNVGVSDNELSALTWDRLYAASLPDVKLTMDGLLQEPYGVNEKASALAEYINLLRQEAVSKLACDTTATREEKLEAIRSFYTAIKKTKTFYTKNYVEECLKTDKDAPEARHTVFWDDGAFAAAGGDTVTNAYVYFGNYHKTEGSGKNRLNVFSTDEQYKYIYMQVVVENVEFVDFTELTDFGGTPTYTVGGLPETKWLNKLFIDPLNPVFPEYVQAYGKTTATGSKTQDLGMVKVDFSHYRQNYSIRYDGGVDVGNIGNDIYAELLPLDGGTKQRIYISVYYINRTVEKILTDDPSYSSVIDKNESVDGEVWYIFKQNSVSPNYNLVINPINETLYDINTGKYILPAELTFKFTSDQTEEIISQYISKSGISTKLDFKNIVWNLHGETISFAGTSGKFISIDSYQIPDEEYPSDKSLYNTIDSSSYSLDFWDITLEVAAVIPTNSTPSSRWKEFRAVETDEKGENLRDPDDDTKNLVVSEFDGNYGRQVAVSRYIIDPYNVYLPNNLKLYFLDQNDTLTFTDIDWIYGNDKGMDYFADIDIITGSNPELMFIDMGFQCLSETIWIRFPIMVRNIDTTDPNDPSGDTVLPLDGGTIVLLVGGGSVEEQLANQASIYYNFGQESGVDDWTSVPLHFNTTDIGQISVERVGTYRNIEAKLGPINPYNIRFTIVVIDPKLYYTDSEGEVNYRLTMDTIPLAVDSGGNRIKGKEDEEGFYSDYFIQQAVSNNAQIVVQERSLHIDSVSYDTIYNKAIFTCSYDFVTEENSYDFLGGDENGSKKLVIKISLPLAKYVSSDLFVVPEYDRVALDLTWVDESTIKWELGKAMAQSMLPQAINSENNSRIYLQWDISNINVNRAGSYTIYGYYRDYNTSASVKRKSLSIVIDKIDISSGITLPPTQLSVIYTAQEMAVYPNVINVIRSDGSINIVEEVLIEYITEENYLLGNLTQFDVAKPIKVGKYYVRITILDYNAIGEKMEIMEILPITINVDDLTFENAVVENNRTIIRTVYSNEGQMPFILNLPTVHIINWPKTEEEKAKIMSDIERKYPEADGDMDRLKELSFNYLYGIVNSFAQKKLTTYYLEKYQEYYDGIYSSFYNEYSNDYAAEIAYNYRSGFYSEYYEANKENTIISILEANANAYADRKVGELLHSRATAYAVAQAELDASKRAKAYAWEQIVPNDIIQEVDPSDSSNYRIRYSIDSQTYIDYSGKPVDAGRYEMTFLLNSLNSDYKNYRLDKSEGITITFEIARKSVSYSFANEMVYNGNIQNPVITNVPYDDKGNPTEGVSLSFSYTDSMGNSLVGIRDVGSYVFTVVIDGGRNYPSDVLTNRRISILQKDLEIEIGNIESKYLEEVVDFNVANSPYVSYNGLVGTDVASYFGVPVWSCEVTSKHMIGSYPISFVGFKISTSSGNAENEPIYRMGLPANDPNSISKMIEILIASKKGAESKVFTNYNITIKTMMLNGVEVNGEYKVKAPYEGAVVLSTAQELADALAALSSRDQPRWYLNGANFGDFVLDKDVAVSIIGSYDTSVQNNYVLQSVFNSVTVRRGSLSLDIIKIEGRSSATSLYIGEDASSVTVNRSILENTTVGSDAKGIVSDANYTDTLYMTETTIKGYGIAVYMTGGSGEFISCSFNNNKEGVKGYNGKFYVSECYFGYNTGTALYVEGDDNYSLDNDGYVIMNNVFESNVVGIKVQASQEIIMNYEKEKDKMTLGQYLLTQFVGDDNSFTYNATNVAPIQ